MTEHAPPAPRGFQVTSGMFAAQPLPENYATACLRAFTASHGLPVTRRAGAARCSPARKSRGLRPEHICPTSRPSSMAHANAEIGQHRDCVVHLPPYRGVNESRRISLATAADMATESCAVARLLSCCSSQDILPRRALGSSKERAAKRSQSRMAD